MAVTEFNGGWTLTAAGDAASIDVGSATRERKIYVKRVHIVKTTAGTLTFKDGDGTVVLVTESIANAARVSIELGIETASFEYDATSAGSAVVTVIGSEVGRS